MKIRISFRVILLVMALVFLAVAAVQLIPRSSQPAAFAINQVAAGIMNGSIAKVSIDGDKLKIDFRDGSQASAVKDSSSTLAQQLLQLGVTPLELVSSRVEINVIPPNPWLGAISLLGFILPFLLIGGVFLLIFRSARSGNNNMMSFGKSNARVVNSEQPKVTFEDVAGLEEAREELKEVVEFLREPQKFIALGARTPKGVLLVGAPGTGKTLLAKAVAGQAGVPFFAISGSEFVEMFVGVGASRVRDLFAQAKKQAPCIIFVDEIDAVGRQRGVGIGGGNDEREQTLNQMLVEMDGFSTDTNVIVIAATNRPDVLDPALLRPGRFDRRVVLDPPDARGREAILRVHIRGKPVDPQVNLSQLAYSIVGFVGADIENLVNEAAILAARRNQKVITQAELEESVERVIAGPERKSRLITAAEKQILAYHEAGHAVVMHALAKADPVFKITIVSRGLTAGYTMPRPIEERTLESRKHLVAEMIGLLGGRSAEELVFNDITSGASNDIERVTQIARAMVTQLGMSQTMGVRSYGKKQEMIFLGRQISEQRDYSDSVAEEIDVQVHQMVEYAHAQARQILTRYRRELDIVAKRLLEIETLTQAEFERLFPAPLEKESGTPVIVLRNQPSEPAWIENESSWSVTKWTEKRMRHE